MDTDVPAQEMAKRYQPTNKYGKRKSDHLDDYDTESERDVKGSDICDVAGERIFSSDSSQGKYENVLNQGKPVGKMQGTRPIFLGIGEGRGNFRGKDRGGGNFRGKGRGRGNFRGKGRGRGNFRGNKHSRSNFKGEDFKGTDQSKGNFRGSMQGHRIGFFNDDMTDNKQHSQKMQTNKKFKFMKQE